MAVMDGWMALAAAGSVCVAVTPAVADEIKLTNGDVLNGTIVSEDDRVLILDHDLFGRMEIPIGDVIKPEPEKPKTEIDYWDLSLDLSFTATTGNTREVNLRFGVNANRNTDATRLALDFSYYWRTSNSITTDNKATVGARND